MSMKMDETKTVVVSIPHWPLFKLQLCQNAIIKRVQILSSK